MNCSSLQSTNGENGVGLHTVYMVGTRMCENAGQLQASAAGFQTHIRPVFAASKTDGAQSCEDTLSQPTRFSSYNLLHTNYRTHAALPKPNFSLESE